MNEAYATAFRTLLSHNATLQPRSLFQQSPVLFDLIPNLLSPLYSNIIQADRTGF